MLVLGSPWPEQVELEVLKAVYLYRFSQDAGQSPLPDQQEALHRQQQLQIQSSDWKRLQVALALEILEHRVKISNAQRLLASCWILKQNQEPKPV